MQHYTTTRVAILTDQCTWVETSAINYEVRFVLLSAHTMLLCPQLLIILQIVSTPHQVSDRNWNIIPSHISTASEALYHWTFVKGRSHMCLIDTRISDASIQTTVNHTPMHHITTNCASTKFCLTKITHVHGTQLYCTAWRQTLNMYVGWSSIVYGL